MLRFKNPRSSRPPSSAGYHASSPTDVRGFGPEKPDVTINTTVPAVIELAAPAAARSQWRRRKRNSVYRRTVSVVAAAVILLGVLACGNTSRPRGVPEAKKAVPLQAEDYLLTEGPETAGLAGNGSAQAIPTISKDDLARCLGFRVDGAAERANGPQLVGTDGLTLVTSSAIVANAGDLERAFSGSRESGLRACLAQVVVQKVRAAFSLSSYNFVPQPPRSLPGIPMAAQAIQIKMSATGSQGRIDIYNDVILVKFGRVATAIHISSRKSPDTGMEKNLARQVSGKTLQQ